MIISKKKYICIEFKNIMQRKPNRISRLIEEQVYFRSGIELQLKTQKRYIDATVSKLTNEIKRLSKGQKQLVDWTGMVFNCYIPKEFCLLNMTLMGLPVTEEIFDTYSGKNMFGAPISKGGIKLYNFKNVFKFFLFSCTEEHIRKLLNTKEKKERPNVIEAQAKIMAKSILKLNPEGTFFFDTATMDAFEKEVYGDKRANEPQKKTSEEETN